MPRRCRHRLSNHWEFICALTSKDGIPFDDVKVRQIIGEWESIGMLKEFIRCSTFPQLGDQFHFPPAVLKIYESLSNTSCTLLVREKFKPGESCGDTIRDIINGKDGSRMKRKQVMQKLKHLKSLADMLQPQGRFELFVSIF